MTRLINLRPSKPASFWLASIPFLIVLCVYSWFSFQRHQDNPDDRLLPTASQLVQAIDRIAVKEDPRTGQVILWEDSKASLQRLLIAVVVSAALALCIGIATGLLAVARAPLSPFIAVLSLIPPMAILPILFIIFGLDELSKVELIVIGIAPFLIRDLQGRVQEIPHEQLIKAQTLDASTWQIAIRIVLPQVMPRLVDSVRLSLGAAWLFLISAEAIAAEQGLGYRIFLVRRYLSMDVIIPYVMWITLLAFFMDRMLLSFNRRCFPWLYVSRSVEER
ncbi:MAG TPA: ABC transporter permease subunit [Pseudomonadales bacterium]|nr:ABC transporter permease subunit [Pseudomonadales bacterium]